MRLLDSGLGDIKNKLLKVSNRLKTEFKKDPSKIPLNVIARRGNIEMDKGQWLREDLRKLLFPQKVDKNGKPRVDKNGDPVLVNKLTMNSAEIEKYFTEKNLNMGALGYGSTKEGLGNLLKWVKHNVNPAKIKGDNRDLKITIEHITFDPKHLNKGVTLEFRVPKKGLESSKDLTNVKLEELGYVGLKKWTSEQLEKLQSSNDKLDKVLVAVLSGKADLKTKVEEVLK